MILLVLCVCLAAELHQSEGSLSHPDDLMTTNLDQQMEIVDTHNEFRSRVVPTASNMLKMSWDDKAAANAQAWANKCTKGHSAKKSRIVDGTNCGENIYMSSAPSSWATAIQSWHNENKDFKHGVGATSKGAVIGHYTQMVWYLSYKVGCAYAFCPDQPIYQHFYICQYCPAGNIKGRKATPYAEGPTCGACPNDCENGLCTNPCGHRNKYTNCDQLAKDWDCDHPFVSEHCQASCKCTTEIR